MSNRVKFICDENDVRLDVYLGKSLESQSRSYVQKLISEGHVTINNENCTVKKQLLHTGDIVEMVIPDAEVLNVEPEAIELDIIYEDDDLIIVNKPQGMVVHPAPGNYSGTLVNALMNISERLSSINGVIRPGIVHRIDKDTSGLLMIAKNDSAHEFLAKQLKDKTTLRVYYALVNGVVKNDTGTIDAPLARHPADRKKISIQENGRNAVTHYEVLERYKSHSLIRLKLETGRTHQIRVHMASIGHPLVGDPVYGLKNEKIKHHGQALHAKQLGFIHPKTQEWMEFDSELPPYFLKLMEKCKAL
jgi:23S rRNA pseudouridine1911/1915/1917 synthase